MYFKPVDQLSPEYQDRWRDERERKRMIDAALEGHRTIRTNGSLTMGAGMVIRPRRKQ